MFFRNRLYSLVERGDFKAIQQLEREVDMKKLNPDYKDSSELVAALNSKSVPAARKACPDVDDYLVNVRCMIVLANLGDQDGAYAIADKLYPATGRPYARGDGADLARRTGDRFA